MTGGTGRLPSDDLRSDEQSAGGGPGLAPHPIWTGLLIAVLAVGLGACDLVPGLEPGGDRRGGADSLRIGLLKSGRVVTGFSGEETLRVRHVAPLEERAAKRAGAGTFLGKAGHACTISLYRPDGPRGPGYYYRSAQITYPDSVVEKAGGETMQLRAWMKRPSVPHASDLEALLQCRLPKVEGAERRVRSFFRFSEEQIRERGLRSADDSTGAGGGKARSKGDCEETTAVVCVDGYCGSGETFGGCTDEDDGWGGGGGVDRHPNYDRRTLQSTGVISGTGDGGPDPGDNDCDSDNPPEWCDIGCKLSASELMPEQKPWLALGSAGKVRLQTFKNLVTKFGDQFGLDNQTEVKHFLAQVAHESESRLLTTEDAIDVSRKEMKREAKVSPDEPKRDGDKIYNLDRVMNSEELQFSIEYGNRMGNGGLSTRDGWTYRGRGAIQLTGENNYEAFNTFYQSFAQKQGWSHPDVTENPGHVASNVRAATMAALNYWKNNVDGKLDSNPTVKEVTKLINGGYNGLSARKKEHRAIEKNVNCSK